MTRAAIYARYSTDLQSEASIDDQLRLCREKAASEGWTVTNCYSDAAISGSSLMRQGIQTLMIDAAGGRFDVVLAESLDRLSRDLEDMAGLSKRLTFAGVKIVTLAEGWITDLHVGLKGTMGQLYLTELAEKTRRGLRGRVEAGKSGGGNSFGYSVVHKHNDAGEPIRGDRVIDPEQAQIVIRIFTEYAAGHSPKAIAKRFNAEKIESPSGTGWLPSTIHGNAKRGTGILNNEIYIGKLIWNRLRYIKDPETGKRVSRENPRAQWIVKDVPEMRIVPQELWDRVKERQKSLENSKPAFWMKQRPRYLLTHLVRCGCCGGTYSTISKNLGCFNAHQKGTCKNELTIARTKLEQAVLDALQNHLMDSETLAEFCDEYTTLQNQIRMEHTAALAGYRAELVRIERKLEQLVDQVADGLITLRSVEGTLIKLEARQDELHALLADVKEAPPLIHPTMAKRYRQEIKDLVAAMSDEEHRAEAADLIRGVVEKIVLTPNEARDGLTIDLHGDLAGILTIACQRQSSSGKDDGTDGEFRRLARERKQLESRQSELQQVKMVAGAGFEPATFRL